MVDICIMHGMQDCVELTRLPAVIDYLKSLDPSQPHQLVELELPPQTFLRSFDLGALPRRCTFRVRGLDHTLRLATGLVAIVHDAILAKNISSLPLLFSHNQFWLLDCFEPLASFLVVQPIEIGLTTIVQMVVDLAAASSKTDGVESVLTAKADATLAAVCCIVFREPGHLLGDNEAGSAFRRLVCSALMRLVKGAITHRPTSRLIATRLIEPALQLMSDNIVMDNQVIRRPADVWVCHFLPSPCSP